MSGDRNGDYATSDPKAPLPFSDLRLEELVGQHDRLVAELETPDPLVEAYTANFLQKQFGTKPDGIFLDKINDDGPQRPVKVGSLQEFQAHLEYGRRHEELRETHQDLLATMLKEGMPLDVWVLTGGGRYVRLEQGKTSPKPATRQAPGISANNAIGPDETEPGDPSPQASTDRPWKSSKSSSPPPRHEHEGDDHEKEPHEQFLSAHQDEPYSTEETNHMKEPGLLFYSVRKEALDELPPEVPAKDVEQVSRRIESFEALPRIRRFGLVIYPFLALICLSAVWLIITFFSAFISLTQLGVILLPLLACVALLHFDFELNGPGAIRAHKRILIERHRLNKDADEGHK